MSVVESVVAGIRAVVIPTAEYRLLLPNASVAEVIDYRQPDPVPEAPDWFLGQIRWRERVLPVVSLSRLFGAGEEQGHRSRIAVCNTLSANPELPFIGLKASAIPQLVRGTLDNLAPGDAQAAPDHPVVLRAVRVADEEALIPNLDELESMVAKVWSSG